MWWLSQSPTPTLQGHQTNWFFTFKAFMSFTVKIFKTMSLWKVTQYLQMWQEEPQWTWCKNYGIPGFPLLWLKFSNTFGKNSPQTPPSCLASSGFSKVFGKSLTTVAFRTTKPSLENGLTSVQFSSGCTIAIVQVWRIVYSQEGGCAQANRRVQPAAAGGGGRDSGFPGFREHHHRRLHFSSKSFNNHIFGII